MKISVRTIPHGKQRYETCGDWWFDKKGNLELRVSDMNNWKFELLVAVHELIEVSLCKDRGITDAKVTAFDKMFEACRAPGNTDEPGDDPQAPYRKEHFFATSLERLLAAELGVDWSEYDKKVNNL